jgi:hypothetical protein
MCILGSYMYSVDFVVLRSIYTNHDVCDAPCRTTASDTGLILILLQAVV